MINVNFMKIFQPFYCKDIVRLGKDYDGGYLINKEDVIKSKKLISLGVGDDYSFEKDFNAINNCDIIAYDGTIDPNQDFLINFYKENKTFINKNIGTGKDEIPFSSLIGDKDVFLKCDIEEHEYSILNDIISNSKLFSGIAIEFHNINTKDHTNDLLNFISKIDLKLIHIHVNNSFYYIDGDQCIPDIIELSFTSSNNISLDESIILPHALDMPNISDREEFKIIF